MKTAFVFPGQGAQYVGRGKDLHDSFEKVREIYREASEALDDDVAGLSFDGPREELDKTFRTQPALLTASYAAYSVLTSKGINPMCVAGHSLGEFSAHVASGSLAFADAVRIVRKRGTFMQEAVPVGVGAMAAVLGMERDVLEKICDECAEAGLKHGWLTQPKEGE